MLQLDTSVLVDNAGQGIVTYFYLLSVFRLEAFRNEKKRLKKIPRVILFSIPRRESTIIITCQSLER